MICFKCLSKMIQIDLINRFGREYKAGYCLKCGNFATRCGERKIWEGKRAG